VLTLCWISKETALQSLLETLTSFSSHTFYEEGAGLFYSVLSRVRWLCPAFFVWLVFKLGDAGQALLFNCNRIKYFLLLIGIGFSSQAKFKASVCILGFKPHEIPHINHHCCCSNIQRQ